MQHFIWSSQGSAIWEVASKLQEDAIQVDVYLHTAAGGAEVVSTSTTHRALTKKKKVHEDSITFPAHKLILAAASPFLKKILSEHYLDHHDACVDITIPHVLPEAMRCILDFLYCGTIGIPPAIRESVLEAANLLQIKNFTDYYPSCVKLEGPYETESTSEKSEFKIIEIPIHKQGRGGKRLSEEKYVHSSVSKAAVQVKEECEADQGGCGHAGTVEARQKRRKIKSKYSTDIYEVNLPRIRKWKKRKMQSFFKTEKEANVQNPGGAQQNEEFEEPDKHIVSNLFSSIMDMDQKIKQSKFEKTSAMEKAPEDFNTDPPPSICDLPPLPSTVALAITDKKHKTFTSQLPLTLASTSSSSVVMQNIFVADQPYLPDSTTKHNSMTLKARSLEPPSVAIASLPSTSLLSGIKELPFMTPPSSIANFPQTQLTSPTHRKISETLQEDKNEEEQEDGLFKFQVLLKECEDFPDEVCPIPPSSQGGSQPGKGSVDINQWISEEIQGCVIPTTSDCDKESNPEEAAAEDHKKDILQEHLTIEEETNTSKETVNNSKDDVECEMCGKIFSDYRSCQSHKRGVHDEAKQMCRYCGKLFRRRCDLYQHERRHRTANLPCKYCGKIFKVAKDLQAHLATHIGGKRFQCIHCDKELTSYRNLKNHIASIHQHHRPYTCQVCKKTYSKASSLQVHVRSVHTGERPFKCSVCGKTFCDAALLKSHQVVHTGERRYSCRVCGRPFSQYSNMISHQRIHTNTRPFLCLICREDFKTKDGLLKHKWVHTGLKPLRCRHCGREFRIKERFERHMLKFHNEVISLPEIFFEVPDEMVQGEKSNTSTPCDIEVIRARVKKEPPEDTQQDQMLDGGLLDGGSTDDLSPVVHLVSSIGEQEVSREPSHVQLSYPLLTTTAGLDEGDNITLGNITGHISCSGHVAPLDVESLLNSEDTATGSALIIAGEERAEVLPATIAESAVRDCEEVVILTKVSEEAEQISQELHPQPTIKLWIPSKRSELEQQGIESNGEGDILIVSSGAFTETSPAGQVLGTEIGPQVVHTMILDGSGTSM
ncbi:uncharacterized protein LOC126989465 isoform X2 [Eriocheir sinensis]|uniref:uncharacterized protein LOC126989465 isoform X2 n=1 Tax=Eriocheir sinensis TaxID=95602 RepID=UPI0021C69EAB|nr:uncharacterized protein LOC126989465 isoform X2 [Eriocheir sinensis]